MFVFIIIETIQTTFTKILYEINDGSIDPLKHHFLIEYGAGSYVLILEMGNIKYFKKENIIKKIHALECLASEWSY